MPPRAESYLKEGQPLPLPENPLPQLTDLLMRIGPGMAGPMGDIPLTAAEVRAWIAGTHVQLTAFDFETLLDLSHAYVQQKIASADPACAAPWVSPISTIKENRAKIAKRVKNLLRS